MKTRFLKTSNLALVFFAANLFTACQKEAKTKPVYFTETEYKVLAPYDSTTGLPSNLEKEAVSSDLLAFVDANLREKQDLRTFNPALLENSNTSTDLRVTQRSDVYLTFLKSVTDNRNAIAFYTYPTSTPPVDPKEIKLITYVYPSAGVGTKLKAGDKVKIGTFDPGTSIGLVLMKDAWQPATGALNNNVVHFAYNDALNPEVDPKLKKHVVLLNYQPENKIIIGFENTDRTTKESDHDFNDVLLYATIK
jgi:hypothetical protein